METHFIFMPSILLFVKLFAGEESTQEVSLDYFPPLAPMGQTQQDGDSHQACALSALDQFSLRTLVSHAELVMQSFLLSSLQLT